MQAPYARTFGRNTPAASPEMKLIDKIRAFVVFCVFVCWCIRLCVYMWWLSICMNC